MNKEYDVAVVGAGPTGTYCAKTLAKNGIKVILLEREKEIGEPNFSTAGTPSETLKKFDIPRETAPYKWNNLCLASPNAGQTYQCKSNFGYVFDFRKLRHVLAEQAAQEGAEIAVGVMVTGANVNDGKVTGVKYRGIMSEGTIKAHIVIDATGRSSAIAKGLKLIDPSKSLLASGLEMEMINVKLPVSNALYCWLGNKFVPNGYAWVFPLSTTEVKIGIGRYMFNGTKYDLKQGLKSFIEGIPWLKDAQPLEFHGGTLLFNSDTRNFVSDGFINLTNTANPLGGEGIRHGLQAAEFAAKVAVSAINNNDYSQKVLQKYNDLWLDYSKNNWHECLSLSKSIYNNCDDKKMDGYLESISHLSGDQLFDILFNYKFEKNAFNLIKSVGLSKIENYVTKV